jgi:signal transduction histidine kinase/CheY-like chemotaxis protein/HAMP domain-containing protein
MGWSTGMRILASWGREFNPMAPGSAIGFLILSVFLFLIIRPVDGPAENRGALYAGALVAFYGFLVFFARLTSLPVNPDEVLFKALGIMEKNHIGSMTLPTGFLFLISGFSIVALVLGLPRNRRAATWLTLSGFLGVFVFLSGGIVILYYFLGQPMHTSSFVVPPSLPTAFSFLFLGGCLTTTAVLHGPASGRWYRTLNDMPIGTQLHFGLGIGLALVIILGAITWRQTDLLWLQTQTLYDHPLQVRRAIGNLSSDILTIHRGMKDMLLNESDKSRENILLDMEACKADAFKQIDRLNERYLGPHDDIEAIHNNFIRWNTIREETIRMIRMGNISEALARTMKDGIGGKQANILMECIKNVDDFSIKNAVQLYDSATFQKRSLNRQLIIIIGFIVFVAFIVSLRLLKGINGPIKHLADVAEQLRDGKLEIRSTYVSANEFGVLSDAFNSLADTVESQMHLNEKTTRITSVMLRETEAHAFCRELIAALVRHTNSSMGAVYLLDREKAVYEHFESIGLSGKQPLSFSADTLTGEFGVALSTGRVHRISRIPKNTVFTFATVAGEIKPREIITIPLTSEIGTMAILSLASIYDYKDEAIRLIEGVVDTVSARMTGVLAYKKIEALSIDLEERNRLLQTQQEELRVANEELEEQTQRLLQSEEELKAQQEELQVSNEELEEKTNLLDRQKQEIEKSRKRIEEKADALALASRYKSEFLANMSHELRTPLNSLLLLAQGLMRNKEGNLTADQVESARIIYGGGNELLNLINDILDLSKIEAGRIDLHVGLIRVSDLVESIRDSFQNMADEKGIDLDIVVEEAAAAEIHSDSKRLGQILKNLVANAVKFTDSGCVSVTFGYPDADTDLWESGLAKDRCLAITVSDTGIGIAPELHAIIFDAFKQADGSTSRKYGGTGLGLSISRQLATLLGGEIQLQSEPGKGSTFTLYLPLSAPEKSGKSDKSDKSTVRPVPAAVPMPVPKRKPTMVSRAGRLDDDRDKIETSDRIMLVIEDDADFARLLRQTCHDKGFKCLLSATGEEGIELAEQYLPSAVILDLGLPGMDGWSVLTVLKENIKTRHIPVHIVSAEDASTKSIHKGAVGHATKPMNQEMLENTFLRLEQMAVGKPKRLLVVDDDAIIRRETVKLIGDGDVTAFEAENGEQALSALRSQKFDCMILDLGLPDMDGGELLGRLEREGIPVPPVVIYTARELTMNEEESIRERAESIVIKDVRSQERLLDEVSLFLHRVVSQMPEKNREVIRSLHDTEAIFKDRKVLVVDDDMRTTFAVSRLLSEKGMKPVKAENGERALRLLDEHPDIDLVLMDIMMPVMDGYETMEKIRAQEKYKNLPIIALTAKAMPEHQAKCLAAGASDYMPKPIDEGRLFSMMRVWLCR